MFSGKFILTAISLAILICIVILIAFYSPKESHEEENVTAQTEFWKRGIVLELYPRSIFDTDADGIGDLQGITAKADYFIELGVEILWLCPIYASPMKDFGYDISNYTEIDPIFGTMDDFDNMIAEMHSKGLKVVLDYVPNHTSDQHEWFQRSLENDTKYRDYYVWKDPLGFNETGDPIPPNNWLSNFRYSAWEWSEERQQFYLHQFLVEQPDLNYRSADVVEEMQNVVRFWMDKGVDGLRVDAIKYLFEVEDVYGADEPVAENSGITDPTEYYYLNHTYTVNQPETFDVTREWYEILQTYDEEKVMMTEVYDSDINQIMRYYGNDTNPVSDFPFNFLFIDRLTNRTDVTGTNLKEIVNLWLDNMPNGKWPNWVLGNHDNGRVSSRLGADLIDSLNMFILLLPGTAVSYYGEEIGMFDTFISYNDTQDPSGCNEGPEHYTETSRDPERTPMQWDDSQNAGFSTANETWLPVNENYTSLNVKLQTEQDQSHIKVYQQLALLRQEDSFQYGTLEFQTATEEVVAFLRTYEGSPTYLVVVNTSPSEITVDVQNGSVALPESGIVQLRSSTDTRNQTQIGSSLNLSELSLIGGEGILLQINEEI